MAFNWTCPYCQRDQSVTAASYADGNFGFTMEEPSYGPIGLAAWAIVCANPECRKPTISVQILEAEYNPYQSCNIVKDHGTVFLSKRILPESGAKPQPDFIPQVLREDYFEACQIRDLSPKASATLARRCIQGMIRDFAGISKGTLAEEIKELRKRVTDGAAPKGVSEESVEAIDHVRCIGNIGAHMEKDINLIVSIEPNEAQILIELIESLFDEWYVARKKREERFASVKQISEQKKTDRKA